MALGKPACPDCGGELLVMKIRTGDIFFGHTLDEYGLHRCYRCFTKFSAAEDSEVDDAAGSVA